MLSRAVTKELSGAPPAPDSMVLICLTASALGLQFCATLSNARMNCQERLLLSPAAQVILFPNMREPTLVAQTGGMTHKTLIEQSGGGNPFILQEEPDTGC